VAYCETMIAKATLPRMSVHHYRSDYHHLQRKTPSLELVLDKESLPSIGPSPAICSQTDYYGATFLSSLRSQMGLLELLASVVTWLEVFLNWLHMLLIDLMHILVEVHFQLANLAC